MISRRAVIAGLVVLPAARALGADPPPLGAILESVGDLEADRFHPRRVLEAIQALVAIGPERGRAVLRDFAAQTPEPPSALFAVIRALVMIPPPAAPPTPWPGVLQPGHLRPPALGAPWPEAPGPPTAFPRFPLLIFSDMPLSVVMGYSLGGQPEPLSMHLEALSEAPWRTTPLSPKSVGELRYLLPHWGMFPPGTPVGDALEGQLRRYESG